jgi:hypothetical protein
MKELLLNVMVESCILEYVGTFQFWLKLAGDRRFTWRLTCPPESISSVTHWICIGEKWTLLQNAVKTKALVMPILHLPQVLLFLWQSSKENFGAGQYTHRPEGMRTLPNSFIISPSPPISSYIVKKNSMVWVRERTIPTERPPLVGEVIANFCG